MFNRSRITRSPAQPWQEAVVRDRGGEGGSSARARSFPSHSLPPRPQAARPSFSNQSASPLFASIPSANPSANPSASRPLASNPFASPLPASNPFASRLPASNSIASRLRASRPLSAPGDGSSSESFYSANSESVSMERDGYDASSEDNHQPRGMTLLEHFDNSSRRWEGPWWGRGGY